MLSPEKFNPCQEMSALEYELQYKKDDGLEMVQSHGHDFFEIYFLVSGDVTYKIENSYYHILPGDLLLIPPHKLHQVCINPKTDAYERYVLWVNTEMLKRLSTEKTNLEHDFFRLRSGKECQLRLAPQQQGVILRLMEILYQEVRRNEYGSDLMSSCCLMQLLVTICRVAAQKDDYLEKVRTSQVVSQAVAYIQNHYAEPLSLEGLAEQLYVSKYHLSHEFQRLVGMSVCRYIQKRRLRVAQQRLMQGEKANDVCFGCGFHDYAGFYRAFKGEYGISPRKYMEQCSQKQIGLF